MSETCWNGFELSMCIYKCEQLVPVSCLLWFANVTLALAPTKRGATNSDCRGAVLPQEYQACVQTTCTFQRLLRVLVLWHESLSRILRHLQFQCDPLIYLLGNPDCRLCGYFLHTSIGEAHSDLPIFWSCTVKKGQYWNFTSKSSWVSLTGARLWVWVLTQGHLMMEPVLEPVRMQTLDPYPCMGCDGYSFHCYLKKIVSKEAPLDFRICHIPSLNQYFNVQNEKNATDNLSWENSLGIRLCHYTTQLKNVLQVNKVLWFKSCLIAVMR